LRERLHVLDLLEDFSVERRREHHLLRAVVLRDARHVRVESREHVLEHGPAAEDAGDADRNDETALDEAVVERLRRVHR